MPRSTSSRSRLSRSLLSSSLASESSLLSSQLSNESFLSSSLCPSLHPVPFSFLPLSSRTLGALHKHGWNMMAEVQRATLPYALTGRDVVGAARTGAGKTLAFLVPVVERLFREQWTGRDGLGAVVIAPTRELAMQIFEVLRQVGEEHDLAAGLLIGGKDFEEEAKRVREMNILICTPGRLLQHLDQTQGFTADQLQILVLDEADRILDLGFEKTLNSILEHFPTTRQTLLFSATQTKSVKQLVRLSLKNPEYVGIQEEMPENLVQTYLECEAYDKFDILFSFMKTHLKSKVIVFVTSCKQVKFLFQMYKRLHPGILLKELHGNMSQEKRIAVYQDFLSQPSALLFSTDLAARGLDFPGVDWIVQMDCPDTVATYVHRSGRTARFKSSGNSLLFLLPSENYFATLLEEAHVHLQRVKANPNKVKTVTSQFASFLAEDPELKYLAQKAFATYLRSVFLQAEKKVLQFFFLFLHAGF